MGYQTGTSTGPNDLIDKLRLFLLAEGWTINGFSAIGAGYRLHVQKSVGSGGPEMFFNFRSAIAETGSLITENNDGGADGTVTGLCINGSTGYDGGQVWHKQPGYPTNPSDSNYSYAMIMSPMSVSAIPAYFFFTIGDSVHIVVEITAGKFQFMSFGCLEKQGIYTGGMYFTASMQSRVPYYEYRTNGGWYVPSYFSSYSGGAIAGAVYLDVDSTASWRRASNAYEIQFPCVVGQQAGEYYSQSGFNSMFWSKGPNFYNNIAAMAPLYVFGKRSDDNYSLLGWPEGVRFLNCTNYSAGQEVVYGTETWKIFHADSLESVPLNMFCGFAFKKEI